MTATLHNAILKLGTESGKVKYDRYMGGSNGVRGAELGSYTKALHAVYPKVPKKFILTALMRVEKDTYNNLLKGK